MKYAMALFVGLLACSSRSLVEVDRTDFAFGSYVRIRVLAGSRPVAESAQARAFRTLRRLDSLWSAVVPSSEVSRVNLSRRARVSAATAELLDSAITFGRETDGALDVTVEPLTSVWGFLDGRHHLPDSTELRDALGRVGLSQVRVCGDSVLLEAKAMIELGSVAVGRAVDSAAAVMVESGARQGMIDAGGDIRVFGDRVWRIGVQDPRGTGVIRTLELRDCAVSTSGDYQKFFEVDGQHYHHILDPATGYPARGCASVTVVAPSALLADAFSTALFVRGLRGAADAVARRPRLGVLVFENDGDSLILSEVGRLE